MVNIQVDPQARSGRGNRVVIRDSNNRVYVFVNPLGSIKAYKGNVVGEPTSFTEQDAAGKPFGTQFTHVAAAIDSTGLVHVLYYDLAFGRGAIRRILYAQFRTSAHAITQDDWVLINEETQELLDQATRSQLLGIAIDANNEPHIIWNEIRVFAGFSRDNVIYQNRIGGSWSIGIVVTRTTDNPDAITGTDIIIANPDSSVNADRPIVAATFFITAQKNMNVKQGDALNATNFSNEALDVTEPIDPEGIAFTTLGHISMAIDSDKKITIAFVEDITKDLMIIEHLHSNPWTTWETPVDVDTSRDYDGPSIAIDGTDRFIFVEDATNNDLNLWKDLGAGFVEETSDADLPNVGTFLNVKVKWASKNNNSPKKLDYVFANDNLVIFYNTINVSTGPGSGGKVIEKGVTLIDLQKIQEREAERKIQEHSGKRLLHPQADLDFFATFQVPVEGWLRHESRFKLQLKSGFESHVKHFKMAIASPEFISRFKLKQKAVSFQSMFSVRTFGRLDINSKFKIKLQKKLELVSRFDFSKIIGILNMFQEFMNLEKEEKNKTLSFGFKEFVDIWYEDEPREKSFDEPSTVIGRVIYTPELQTMEIELPGQTYNYCGVPERIFDSFKGAGSKGAFYNREIKGIFTC